MFMIDPTPLPNDAENEPMQAHDDEVNQSSTFYLEDEWDNINGDLILFI